MGVRLVSNGRAPPEAAIAVAEWNEVKMWERCYRAFGC